MTNITVVFYKLECISNINVVYVGRTVSSIKMVISKLKTKMLIDESTIRQNLHQGIRDNGGIDNFRVILIEYKTFISVLEMNKYKNELILKYGKGDLNKYVAHQSVEDRKIQKRNLNRAWRRRNNIHERLN
jgi:hypothetical protein